MYLMSYTFEAGASERPSVGHGCVQCVQVTAAAFNGSLGKISSHAQQLACDLRLARVYHDTQTVSNVCPELSVSTTACLAKAGIHFYSCSSVGTIG